MSNNDAQRYAQADAITLLIEHAATLQEEATRVLSKVSKAQDAMAGLPSTLGNRLTNELSTGLAEPAGQASERMSEQLLGVIKATEGAAERMSALARSINRRMVLMYLTLTAVALSLVVGVACYMGVAPWLMEARRKELSELQASLDALRKKGAGAQIARCPDANGREHPCIRIDSSYGTFGEKRDYLVIKGQ